jgi:hypothetical protein
VTTKARERRTGRYAYELDCDCVCGHKLSEHTAERARVKGGDVEQPCLADDCECMCFKPARKRNPDTVARKLMR